MAAAPGFLEFFILEASDYIERLDALLLGGKPAGPDGDALQRAARALRGTATMAKLPAFAELAAGVERVGRAIHDGSLRWEPALSGAMIAAIDDLKTLLHATRTWSGAEDKRARDRANELARFVPVRPFARQPLLQLRVPSRVARHRRFLRRKLRTSPPGSSFSPREAVIRRPPRMCCAGFARSAAWPE